MQEKQIRLRLQAINAIIAESQPREVVFRRIVDAVHHLGFDRVRLDLLSADGRLLEPVAVHGFDGDGPGGPVPAVEDEDLLLLSRDPRPHVLAERRGCVPVLLRGRVVGKLSVDHARFLPSYDVESLEDVFAFAQQAALVLAHQKSSWADSLEALQSTTLAIASVRNRDEILRTIVEQSVKLLGAKSGGLYEYRPEQGELVVIADYNRPEQVGRTLRIGEGLAGRLIASGERFATTPDYYTWEGRAEIYGGPRKFGAVLEVPLVWEEQVIGVLYVDDEAGRSFSETEARLLSLFADQAAISLSNSALLERDQRKLQRLGLLAQVTLEMMGNLDVMSWRMRLEVIARSAAEILEAETTGVFRVRGGDLVLEASFGQLEKFEPGRIRLRVHNEIGGGLTGWIAYHGGLFNQHGEELKHHPAVAHSASHAASGNCYSLLAIPLKRRVGDKEELIGLIRADNKTGLEGPALAKFTQEDEQILTIFAEAAVIAIESAELVDRLKEQRERLESLQTASNALTEADDPQSVMQQIVASIRQMLKADAAILWSYDSKLGNFIPESSIYDGDSLLAWEDLKGDGPRRRGFTFQVMDQRWLGIEDFQGSDRAASMGPAMRRFLEEIGARSLQGFALKVGREKLGVVYALYTRPTRLEDEERETVLAFAERASLELKRARLLQQLQRARKAAEVVARLTLLEDGKATLASIVREIREALDCGAVVLFRYDQEAGALILPPTMAGAAEPSGETRHDSLVLTMIEHSAPYIVTDVAKDPLFKEDPLTRSQAIKSCVAISLKAGGRKVGVLFINYRNPRRFTVDEISNMELFANQAAVAIRNVQLFEELATKLSQQEGLAGLSKEVLAASSVQDTMVRAVKFAARALETEFCNMVLPDREGRLVFSAAAGWEENLVGTLVLGPGQDSQTGYTIQQRVPVAVFDYRNETRFRVPEIVLQHGIQSGLSAAMFRGGEVLGVMLVHTRKPRRFTQDDATLLSLIANQTAVALERAQQHEASQRKSAYLKALYEASKALTTQLGLERRQVLEQIIQPAIKGIVGLQGPQPILGTIEIYDEDRDELIMESVYPPELSGDLFQRVGERRGVRRALLKGEGIGIVGRTVVTGQPQLVRDVLSDPDYVAYRSATRSELAVPLIDRDLGRVIGVLNVESDHVGAFQAEDQEALQALAELAVIAIQNARRMEAIRTQTTLAWMGLGNAVGRHELEGQIGMALAKLQLLEQALEADNPALGRVEELLADIERRLQSFSLDRPAGQADEGLSSILVNEELIDAFHRRFLESHRGWRQRFTTFFELERAARIRANRDWLFRVLDILVNNAAQASARNIVLGSRPGPEDSWVEIYVADDGRGIPEEIRSRLLREPIREGSKGLGTGLLIAQEVVRSYRGSIRFENRQPQGTMMIISLPLDAQN